MTSKVTKISDARTEPDEPPVTNPARDQYEQLAEKFGKTHRRQGNNFDYLTGFQVVDRLNAVLGFDCWQFEIIEHGVNDAAEEIWVLGRLTIWSATGRKVNREQFGSQKINKRRSDGLVLDIGFDLKGATTDALKKCASLVGVGLYLSAKDDDAPTIAGAQETTPRTPSQAPPPAGEPPKLSCELCTREIRSVNLPDKTTISAADFASRGRAEFGKVLCVEHFSAARKAKTDASQNQAAPDAASALQAAVAGPGTNTTPTAPKAADTPAQAQGGASSAVAPDAPLMVNGRPDPRVVAARYGAKVASYIGKGYKAPTPASKKGLYASLSKNLNWSREDMHKLLGLNPNNQHLEDWMQLAQADTSALYNLAFLRHQDEDVRVPSYADLTHGA